MPSLDNWLGNTLPLSGWLDDHDRAVDTARTVSIGAVTLTIQRDGAENHTESVRLEPLSLGREAMAENALVSNTGMLIVGYKGHASIDDTDIKRGDRFVYGGQKYEVQSVLPGLTDRFMAVAEASQ